MLELILDFRFRFELNLHIRYKFKLAKARINGSRQLSCDLQDRNVAKGFLETANMNISR